VAATLAFAGCAHHIPITRLGEDALFQSAMTAYRHHKWDDAINAFQQFTFRFPNSNKVAEARYLLADSYFGKREFVTAATEFDRLANDYPAGPWADDARFKVCLAYQRLSPNVELDQKYTGMAIDHCQSLITYYPQSEYVSRARTIIKEMRNKLARKAYIGGEYYFKRGAYDSSIIYYDDVVNNYPDSPSAPDALLREVEAYDKIGYKDEAQTARQRLLKNYPDSQAAKDARQTSANAPPLVRP
jgi:outer membrane protein assembly factor BamD